MEEKWDREIREAAGDGATSRLVKMFEFGKIDNVKKRKPSG